MFYFGSMQNMCTPLNLLSYADISYFLPLFLWNACQEKKVIMKHRSFTNLFLPFTCSFASLIVIFDLSGLLSLFIYRHKSLINK